MGHPLLLFLRIPWRVHPKKKYLTSTQMQSLLDVPHNQNPKLSGRLLEIALKMKIFLEKIKGEKQRGLYDIGQFSTYRPTSDVQICPICCDTIKDGDLNPDFDVVNLFQSQELTSVVNSLSELIHGKILIIS